MYIVMVSRIYSYYLDIKWPFYYGIQIFIYTILIVFPLSLVIKVVIIILKENVYTMLLITFVSP
jgi:hypothetical protein